MQSRFSQHADRYTKEQVSPRIGVDASETGSQGTFGAAIVYRF